MAAKRTAAPKGGSQLGVRPGHDTQNAPREYHDCTNCQSSLRDHELGPLCDHCFALQLATEAMALAQHALRLLGVRA